MKHIAQFMKRYIILILSFLTSSCWLMAQPYIIKRLGIEQGLSNNYVVGITQDKQGFLWFATEEGLNKFDGTRFITYYKNDPSKNSQSITGNELRYMLIRSVPLSGLPPNATDSTLTTIIHKPSLPIRMIRRTRTV